MASRERTEGARYLAQGFSFSILGQFRLKLRYENRLRLARKLSTLRSRKTLGSFVGVAYRFDNSTSVVDQLKASGYGIVQLSCKPLIFLISPKQLATEFAKTLLQLSLGSNFYCQAGDLRNLS